MAVLFRPSPLYKKAATSSGVFLIKPCSTRNSTPFLGSILNFFFPIWRFFNLALQGRNYHERKCRNLWYSILTHLQYPLRQFLHWLHSVPLVAEQSLVTIHVCEDEYLLKAVALLGWVLSNVNFELGSITVTGYSKNPPANTRSVSSTARWLEFSMFRCVVCDFTTVMTPRPLIHRL